MIDTDCEEHSMVAETDIQDHHGKGDGDEKSHDSSSPARKMNILSLMESEDEDDEEEADEEDETHSVLMSRNPSLSDADLEYGETTRTRTRTRKQRRDSFSREEDEDYRAGISEGGGGHFLRPSAMPCEPSHMPLCYPQIPGCQGSLAEQIDFMTQCRHPLDIFSVFHEHTSCKEPSERLLPGMYALPRQCEYCGAPDTDGCGPGCQRPKLFFRRKRPPFCPPDPLQWEPLTDYERKQKEDPPEENELDPTDDKPRGSKFMFKDLFH